MDLAQRKDENNVCNKKAPKKGRGEKKRREKWKKKMGFPESPDWSPLHYWKIGLLKGHSRPEGIVQSFVQMVISVFSLSYP